MSIPAEKLHQRLRFQVPHRKKKEEVLIAGKHVSKAEQLVNNTAWSLIVIQLAGAVIMTAYFFITQVRYGTIHLHGVTYVLWLKPHWDAWLDSVIGSRNWKIARHLARNLYDPTLATLFVKTILANWRKGREGKQAPLWYVALSPLILLASSTVLIGLAVALVIYVPALQAIPTTLTQLVAGILIGLVIHPLYAPAGRRIQQFFIDRQEYKAKMGPHTTDRWKKHAPRRWMPFVWQGSYWHALSESGCPETPSNWVRVVIPAFAVIVIAMALFGLVIKFGIAPGRIHLFGV